MAITRSHAKLLLDQTEPQLTSGGQPSRYQPPTLCHGGIVSNGCDEFHCDDIDVFFCFEMVLTTRNLQVAPYSDDQTELHDIIQNLHDEGLGYRTFAASVS